AAAALKASAPTRSSTCLFSSEVVAAGLTMGTLTDTCGSATAGDDATEAVGRMNRVSLMLSSGSDPLDVEVTMLSKSLPRKVGEFFGFGEMRGGGWMSFPPP